MQLVVAFIHRRLWEQVREEIRRVHPHANGTFVWSYTQVYAQSVMMTLRRVTEPKPKTDSLWSIWESIRLNPTLATRADYVEIAAGLVGPEDVASVREQSDIHFTESFGDGLFVDPEKIAGYQAELRKDADDVIAFVDKHIAHLDRRSDAALDISEVHVMMGRVTSNANHLHRLLDRQLLSHEHAYLPSSWKVSLRTLFDESPSNTT